MIALLASFFKCYLQFALVAVLAATASVAGEARQIYRRLRGRRGSAAESDERVRQRRMKVNATF